MQFSLLGEWLDDKKHGYGTFVWSNGNKYQGGWEKNQQKGKGMLDCLIDSAPAVHATGIFTWANNSKYEGEYENGKKHGFGVYTLEDGGVYVCISFSS